MDLIREVQYLDPDKWQSASVTWLKFKKDADGAVLISEEGRGVIQGLTASGKWDVEALEGGGWKATPKKSGGKLDLYLETTYRGEPFTVDAVVPKFNDEAYLAVYRGIDYLFSVVQKKHPEAAAG
jgi:hypothetical protein